jgi:hypothetical protein
MFVVILVLSLAVLVLETVIMTMNVQTNELLGEFSC